MPFRKNRIALLGTGIHHGQPKPGVEKAYATLKAAGLFEDLLRAGVDLIDCGDLAEKLFAAEEPYRELYAASKELLAQDATPLLLGGDHSQAFATVSALLESYPNIKIIWIDAHGDINTPETSPTGNLHGMPLSGLLGIVDKNRFQMPWLKQDLRPENVALIGIRDLDRGEMDLIKSKGVLHFPIEVVRERGVGAILKEIGETWGETEPVHLSFDIDGLDSLLVPATGTPVGNGLSVTDMHELVKIVRDNFSLVSCEVVEFNPDLAKTPQELDTTIATIRDLFNRLLT